MNAARLAGQVAVVTGGALGIGGGISRRLAAAGAHVVLGDINGDAAEAARRDIAAADGLCTVVVGDVREPKLVSRVAQIALEVAQSRIDILVNNVGDFRPAARTFLHSTEDQWQLVYELNLLHVLRMRYCPPWSSAAAGRSSTTRRLRPFGASRTPLSTPRSTPG